MTDTSKHIQELYADFFRQKTHQERFQLGFQMMEDGRNMVATTLRQQHPDWSETELKIGVFTRMYQHDFSAEQLTTIIASFPGR